MNLRSSKAVTLMLIGSIGVLWGFKSCIHSDYGDYYDDGSTTQPSGSGSSSHSFWHSGYRGFWGGSGGAHTGTGRGGFGSTGHGAGHGGGS